jgi:hypothetical protein
MPCGELTAVTHMPGVPVSSALFALRKVGTLSEAAAQAIAASGRS